MFPNHINHSYLFIQTLKGWEVKSDGLFSERADEKLKRLGRSEEKLKRLFLGGSSDFFYLGASKRDTGRIG